MRQRARRFFTVPNFQEKEELRRGQYLLLILGFLLLGLVIAAFINLLVWEVRALYLITVVGLAAGSSFVLLKRGSLFVAGLLIVSVMLGVNTLAVYSGNGVHDILIIAYPIILVVASLVLERRTFGVAALMVLFIVGGLAYGELRGWIVSPYSVLTTPLELGLLLINLGGLSMMLFVLVNQMVQSLEQARRSQTALKDASSQISQHVQRLSASELALQHETRESLLREHRLNTVARTISSTLDLSVVLERVVRLTAELVQADAGFLSLLSDDGRSIGDLYDFNIPSAVNGVPLPKGEGLTWDMIETCRSIILEQYAHHPQALPELVQAGMKAFIGAPILAGDVCLGALGLLSARDDWSFSDRDLALLESIGRQAGAAIRNARLYAARQQELAERKRVESELRLRDAILSAVTFAAEQFLTAQDWRAQIMQVLQQLGAQLGASRAWLFENHLAGVSGWVASLHYEWAAPGLPACIDQPDYQNLVYSAPGAHDWRQASGHGEALLGDPRTLYADLKDDGSMLAVPVSANGLWWGMMVFLDDKKKRFWSLAEVDAIKVAAGILGAAIQRQEMDTALHRQETLYQRAIASAGAVPYYQDYAENAYTFMGEGILELTGYSATQMTPDLWDSLVVTAIPTGEAAGLSYQEAIWRSRHSKISAWRCDYAIRVHEGDLRWIADSAVEVFAPDGSLRGSIGILQDITERKQIEQQMRHLNTLLEERVQERTAELETANRELQAFAYSVSHDLRAPLRGIDGYSKLLIEEYGEQLSEEGQFYLQNVRRAAQRMDILIRDLLVLSRVTRAEIRFTSFNLSAVAGEIFQELQRQDAERNVQVVIQPGLEIEGDATLLRVMLENILGNAWKFTSRMPAARIEVGMQQNGEECIFFFRDNGVGFSMKYVDRIFGAFQRLHGDHEFEGTGIGLATVQRIVLRHGGRVWAHGEPGQGATIFVSLPAR